MLRHGGDFKNANHIYILNQTFL